MKVNKREQAVPQPQYETVTTYELTQEEMYVLMLSAGLTSLHDRQTCMTYEQAQGFFLFYDNHIDTVVENQS